MISPHPIRFLTDLDVFDLVLETPHSPDALLHHLAVVGALFGGRHQILARGVDLGPAFALAFILHVNKVNKT